ncbi:hypothetical protein Q5762_31545 [Streptomyces sp. P9(2023)]|uniref:hypothetical protein n=1 Tax=Streptomyces sp. P9(2023) TaxID=3064394 RepID=UPI0028F42499|nr:hypothetical protein [Streptomyces sp. P9(2023)]MDT9692779.1 hypothetical protein [Streptomyces sp. P9(2023)]
MTTDQSLIALIVIVATIAAAGAMAPALARPRLVVALTLGPAVWVGVVMFLRPA